MLNEIDMSKGLVPSSFGQNVAYGLSVEFVRSRKVFVLGADKALVVPEIGSTYQIANYTGVVQKVHHEAKSSGGTPPVLQFHAWVLVD